MKKRSIFVLNTLGWLMIFTALIMGVVYFVGSDYALYYEQQTKAGILEYSGISDEDLRRLDKELSEFLFHPLNADTLFFYEQLEVFGKLQPPFNEKELIHLKDCRRLLAPTAEAFNYCVLIGAGLFLVLCGKQKKKSAAWRATLVILLPIAILGLWAAIDFNSAFNFFHKILFTNDLWLLDPRTDLLIRICPASMFANMGMRIALMSAAVLIGVPAALTLIHHLSVRKRKPNETEL